MLDKYQQILKPSSIWVSQGLNTLDDFKQKLPEIKFINSVSDDVVKYFDIVRKLLIHSFFEYEFIDVAFTKALTGFEMALKIRYQELTGEKARIRLHGLIKWGIKANLFEFDDSIDSIRELRNYSVHPENYHFGGLALFNSFSIIADTINGLYLDPVFRKQRKDETVEVNTILDDFTKEGAILEIFDKRLIIFNTKMLFLDNISKPNKYYFQFWPIFDVPVDDKSDFELPKPLRICSNQWLFENKVFYGDNFILTRITGVNTLERFKLFKEQYHSSKMLKSHMLLSIGREINILYNNMIGDNYQ